MEGIVRRRELIAGDKPLYFATNIICTGSNFFDTGFAPFSADNINRDFKISFRIRSFTPGTAQAVLLGCKYEGTLSGLSYPGIYVRRRNSYSQFEIGGYNYWTLNYADVIGHEVSMIRQNGGWTATIDGTMQALSVRSTVFNQNIVLGAGVQTNSNKFRYAICTFDYVRIEYI